MNDETFQPPLTPAGEDRKREILRHAIEAAAGRRKRRAARKVLLSGAATAAVIGVVFLLPIRSHSLPKPASTSLTKTSVPPPPLAAAPETVILRPRPTMVVIQRVTNDPAAVAAMRVRTVPNSFERLDDGNLLNELNHAGYVGGLLVRDGRPQLWVSAGTVARPANPD